jgi:hypothetical protein
MPAATVTTEKKTTGTSNRRKKQAVVEMAVADPVAEPVVEKVIDTQEPSAAKKKSVKKPVKIVAVVTPDGIEGSFSSEPRRPLIAHLQIKPSEVRFTEQRDSDTNGSVAFIDTKSSEPSPYDPQWQQPASELKEIGDGQYNQFSQDTAVTASISKTDTKAPACFTQYNLMVQYKNSSEQKTLPECTDIACFWCAHSFDWRPCVIPEREVNGVYQVYGNFCTPECGVAYLLSEPIDPHVRWERMSLIHRIYDQAGKGRICPAPARESLRLFGGPLGIESFRGTIKEGKIRIDLHMPPMVSILGSIDTKPIDFFDINMRNGAQQNPLQIQRPISSTGEEGLRLKRTKPLKDRESTLDTVMNIKIGSSRKV